MATKKKKKTVAKKTTATVLNSNSAFTKGFPQFQQFSQFQPFKMDSDLFKGSKQMEKFTQGAATMGQDQVDALVKSTTIFAKGMEDIMKTCMEIAQEAGEKGQSVAKSAMACKTLNELTDFQTKLAQASFDDFMTNATLISEKAVKLCTDTMAPINDQVGKTMKRAGSAAA